MTIKEINCLKNKKKSYYERKNNRGNTVLSRYPYCSLPEVNNRNQISRPTSVAMRNWKKGLKNRWNTTSLKYIQCKNIYMFMDVLDKLESLSIEYCIDDPIEENKRRYIDRIYISKENYMLYILST